MEHDEEFEYIDKIVNKKAQVKTVENQFPPLLLDASPSCKLWLSVKQDMYNKRKTCATYLIS